MKFVLVLYSDIEYQKWDILVEVGQMFILLQDYEKYP